MEQLRETKSDKKIAAVFHDKEQFDVAIKELEKSFPRRSINVLNVDSYQNGKNFNLSNIDDYKQGIHVHPEERTLGFGAIIAVATFIGTGISAAILTQGNQDILQTLSYSLLYGAIFGLISAGLIYLFNRRLNETIKYKLKRGGLVVWVKTKSIKERVQAKNIFYNFGANNVKSL